MRWEASWTAFGELRRKPTPPMISEPRPIQWHVFAAFDPVQNTFTAQSQAEGKRG